MENFHRERVGDEARAAVAANFEEETLAQDFFARSSGRNGVIAGESVRETKLGLGCGDQGNLLERSSVNRKPAAELIKIAPSGREKAKDPIDERLLTRVDGGNAAKVSVRLYTWPERRERERE